MHFYFVEWLNDYFLAKSKQFPHPQQSIGSRSHQLFKNLWVLLLNQQR
ncbi:hypothetical protein GNE12_26565 (plasmid) [Trichormus variabilis N2B]|uniref:Transposase n=1 Tax=Trichormus variabilis N2B TaxID=2681315 RepID=A0ABR6SGD0_ANAVA|nr:hypothetical protein [Trichormus variabilis N2B]